jgi:KUP system potassium uptake protein
MLRRFSLSEERGFGLDTSSVTTEVVPLVLSPAKGFELKRVDELATSQELTTPSRW